MDDKHTIKVGEPSYPVEAVERANKCLYPIQKSFEVGDHDFTKFSMTPSVAFFCKHP